MDGLEDSFPESKIAKFRKRLLQGAGTLEARLIGLLRYSSLFIAVLILVASACLLAYGVVQQVGATKVDPKTVSINAEDVTPSTFGETTPQPKKAVPKPAVSQKVRNQTLALYNSAFKGFERAGSKIAGQSVVDLIWDQKRIKASMALLGETSPMATTSSLRQPNSFSCIALGSLRPPARLRIFRRA